MRILITNDDGIDSIGLHVLARTMRHFGNVVIAAPDSEYSGYGAAIGSIWDMKPRVQRTQIEGIDEAWAVSAAPALCALFGRLGAFGNIDLVVSGINQGANVGHSVYHSGTVGACLTARNGGINAVAVSQSIDDWGATGQDWEAGFANQHWQGAADIAALVVQQLITDLPTDPVVININVPNRSAAKMEGWQRTKVCSVPPHSIASASLISKPGYDDAFTVEMSWEDPIDAPTTDDAGAVMAGYASVTWLNRLESEEPNAAIASCAESALDSFFS